jgi:hypothetical protein
MSDPEDPGTRLAGPGLGAGKLAVMRSGEQREGTGRHPAALAYPVPPVQSFLFGHSRAEVVYDCR